MDRRDRKEASKRTRIRKLSVAAPTLVKRLVVVASLVLATNHRHDGTVHALKNSNDKSPSPYAPRVANARSSSRRKKGDAVQPSGSRTKETAADDSACILSSPFLDSFQEEVHEIVSSYRREVRNTFQSLTRNILQDRETQKRQQRQRNTKRGRESTNFRPEDEATSESYNNHEAEIALRQGDVAEKVDSDQGQAFMDDWDDVLTPAAASGSNTDTEPPVERERFDIFSDLIDHTVKKDDGNDDFVVGDTDEDDEAFLERVLSSSGVSDAEAEPLNDKYKQDTPAAAAAAIGTLDSLVAKTATKKKKRKKIHAASTHKGKSVTTGKDKVAPIKTKSTAVANVEGSSDATAAKQQSTAITTVRSISTTLMLAGLYVLMVILAKALTKILIR